MKSKILSIFGLGVVSMIAFTACSDKFLEDKRNYDNVTPEIYNYFEGANARVSDLYSWALPNTNAADNVIGWKYGSYGAADKEGKSTEEYAGFGLFVDPQKPISVSNGNVPDYFYGQLNNIQESAYGRIRNINDVIIGLEGVQPGEYITQEQINQLLGQAYFLRAWCYYRLVQWFGGVPIVKDMPEPVEGYSVPRSSTKDCIDFIISDLDKSKELLGSTVWTGNDFGRVTAGTACALKGRVLLLWASPIFNRANDESRWKTAYETMKAELSTINACGYGLYQPTLNDNGEDFAGMFSQTNSPEAVFTVQYNTTQSGTGQKNNQWERYIRPKNTSGNGTLHPSKMIIDLFPMKDGKMPNLSAFNLSYKGSYNKLAKSSILYDEEFPMANRDPRFYRTFAFPGVRWAYDGNNSLNKWEPGYPSYNNGKDYELWSYVWYTKESDQGDIESGNQYAADSLLGNGYSWYVRKRTLDADVKSTASYVYDATVNGGGFVFNSAPYIELRYAEVLLNLAEAACGAGQMAEAVGYLRQIRQRVGYTETCGLSADLEGDQAACMSAVLYERMIELAYEGKRFHDLRRWLLFDGGTAFSSIEGAPSSWTLTGWGGNTCTWLGITPLNDQRREYVEFRTADKYGVGDTKADTDPLLKYYTPSVLDSLRNMVQQMHKDDPNWTTDSINKYISKNYNINQEVYKAIRPNGLNLATTGEQFFEQLDKLKVWYYGDGTNKNPAHLKYKLRKGDSYDTNKVPLTMKYLPYYYLFGFTQGSMNNNTALPQTIGWEDTNTGKMGTFDPLAE